MDARSGPGLNDPFEEAIDDALSSLPADLRAAMSNVEIVVEDEPPDGQPLLGHYRGVPLPRRSSTYSGVLPDKISIFGGPITRLAAGDADRLRREVRHVVLHEIRAESTNPAPRPAHTPPDPPTNPAASHRRRGGLTVAAWQCASVPPVIPWTSAALPETATT
jgi:predicted Zn-dependent protease with MMP-like domain